MWQTRTQVYYVCDRSVKRAAIPDNRVNTCDGSVGGNSMAFTLDTGAMISVIHQEYVSDMAEKCGEVTMTDANAGTRKFK